MSAYKSAVSRDGSLLVLRTGASLPNRCLKCNGPGHGSRIQVKLRWAPFWKCWLAFLVVLAATSLIGIVLKDSLIRQLSALGFLYLAGVVITEESNVGFNLCARHRRSRQLRRVWVPLVGGILGGSLLIGSFALPSERIPKADFLTSILGGVGALWGATAAYFIFGEVVRARRIEGDCDWVTGASEEFLANLHVPSGSQNSFTKEPPADGRVQNQ